MRCRRREGPWGSHQVEARALKCETSMGLTEEGEEEEEEEDEPDAVLWERNWAWTNLGAPRRRRRRLRREAGEGVAMGDCCLLVIDYLVFV